MKVKRGQHDEFVLRSHRYFTASEMARDLDIAVGTVVAICERLGAPAVTVRDQQKDFILAHKHWCREKLAQKLGVADPRIVELCDELELNLPLKDEPKVMKSVPDILREWWL